MTVRFDHDKGHFIAAVPLREEFAHLEIALLTQLASNMKGSLLSEPFAEDDLLFVRFAGESEAGTFLNMADMITQTAFTVSADIQPKF